MQIQLNERPQNGIRAAELTNTNGYRVLFIKHIVQNCPTTSIALHEEEIIKLYDFLKEALGEK